VAYLLTASDSFGRAQFPAPQRVVGRRHEAIYGSLVTMIFMVGEGRKKIKFGGANEGKTSLRPKTYEHPT